MKLCFFKGIAEGAPKDITEKFRQVLQDFWKKFPKIFRKQSIDFLECIFKLFAGKNTAIYEDIGFSLSGFGAIKPLNFCDN